MHGKLFRKIVFEILLSKYIGMKCLKYYLISIFPNPDISNVYMYMVIKLCCSICDTHTQKKKLGDLAEIVLCRRACAYNCNLFSGPPSLLLKATIRALKLFFFCWGVLINLIAFIF